tara:strand:+ start:1900 stop:3399 length:1500 start_codon:yes stop_codon:yes gene_type:complete
LIGKDLFQVRKIDEVSLRITSPDDSGSIRELAEHFTFYAEGYKFMPSYRNKMWDGKIRLFNIRNNTLPAGLFQHIIDFAVERGYECDVDDSILLGGVTKKNIDEFISTLPLCVNGEKIEARDYQIDAVKHALLNERAVLVSPTGSGKSLIIYILVRWFLENFDKKALIVVPTTSLVEQMYKDFLDYASDDKWFDEDDMHRIYSGKEKIDIDQRVIITTWQSIFKLPKQWFSDYGLVVGDEAHNFKAKSLNSIMSKLSNAKLRFGTTGTLDGSQVHELVLEGNFGPVYKVTTTKKLMDSDTLAQMKIESLVIKYSDQTRKEFGKKKYQEEIDYIVSHEKRNLFIKNLALDQKGNTLVLYNLVEKHGKPLHKLIMKAAGKRKVFYVSGAVNAEEREKIREITEKEKNAIIVASVGTFSTGINIRNLHNIIFASPTKSQVRVLQSIGRGLRKSDNGQITVVYDLADDLSWKKRKNYTLNHAIERVKIYAREKFNFETHEVPL